MRKFFGVLFVILAVVCLPFVFTPSIPETIGRLIGWALVSVLPAYLLLRARETDDDKHDKNEKDKNMEH